MPSTALQHLETLLQARKLDRTLLSNLPDRAASAASTGLEPFDLPLQGGWRRGEVSELVGPVSSGRTRVLMATLAAATSRGEVVGLVDAVDRFDPVTAATAGVDLTRVLWVRGPSLTVEQSRPGLVEQAVQQAIRAGDLIVRAGGFGIVAIDFADVPPRGLRGLPFTTWLRLAHATEGRDTACLLVGQAPMGRSARGVSAALEASSRWTGSSAQSRRFAGLDIRMHVAPSGRRARWPGDAAADAPPPAPSGPPASLGPIALAAR